MDCLNTPVFFFFFFFVVFFQQFARPKFDGIIQKQVDPGQVKYNSILSERQISLMVIIKYHMYRNMQSQFGIQIQALTGQIERVHLGLLPTTHADPMTG